jgi:hypothetical protein
MELHTFLEEFADALAAVDASGARYKHYQPGIGPFSEADAVKAGLAHLKKTMPAVYGAARICRAPDLLIPGAWALEFKVVRPYGDNGKEAESWSQNLVHPYEGNVSSLGDALKLLKSTLGERKAIVVFGFEHAVPMIQLEPVVSSFELLARHALRLEFSPRCQTIRCGLVHPVHQVLHAYAWEIIGVRPKNEANKAPEPTPGSVTLRASSR